MKTTLFLIGLLLAIECYSRFDTLNPKCTISKVELRDQGVWMQYNCFAKADTGFSTFRFEQLPYHLDPKTIQFDFPNQMQSGPHELIETKPIALKLYLKKKQITEKIRSLEQNLVQLIDSLKAYTVQEKSMIIEKYKTIKKIKGAKDIELIDAQFARGFDQISAKKMNQYQSIKRLRFQIKELKDELSLFLRNAGKNNYTMFLNVYKTDSVNIKFKWSVLQSYDEEKIEALTQEIPLDNSPPKSFTLSGQMYDKNGYAPVTNAHLSVYRGRDWIQETKTDEKGGFKFELKESGNYSLVVEDTYFSKNKNKFLLNEEQNKVHRKIILKSKTKLSAWEMAAYALPIIEVVKTVVQE